MIFPMRDITNLSTRAKIKRAGVAINSEMIHEPGTVEVTQHVIKILDAKYEKGCLNPIVTKHCNHLSISSQENKLKLLMEFENLCVETLRNFDTDSGSLGLK